MKDPNVAKELFKQVDSERRVKDVAQARSLYNDYQYYAIQRLNTFANVRGQLEGARPYDPRALESSGVPNLTNVNFGDAQAARDRTLLPYWKAVHSAPHAANFQIESGAPQVGEWEVGFAECFDIFLRDWHQDYFVNYMRVAKNFVDFGPGMVMWENADDPRFKAINVQRVFFPKNATMDPSTWECVIVEREMSSTDLWAKIRNKKEQKNSSYVGWNADAIRGALVWAKDGASWDGRDFTRWEDMLVNNDIAISTKFQPITVIYLYLKQFDGTIGCYAFTKVDSGEEFLYQKDDYAEDFRSILGAIWYDTGTDGMVHSIKGFGIKNYHFSVLVNRMKSKVCDGATIAMALNLIRSQDTPDEEPPIQMYNGVNIFPPGMQQFTTYPQFSQGIQVVSMLSNNQAENNALYREQAQQIEQTDTATQAKILASMQSDVTEASMTVYLSQVGENIFKPCFDRLRRKGNVNEDAKKFVKRCRARGIPDEVIFDSEVSVSTGASAGLASPQVRAMKFGQAMQLAANRPGWNARWFDEQYIANEFGSRAVSKALLPEGSNGDPMQTREALQENGDFGQGMPLPVAPEDNHVVHLDTHLQPLEQQVQASQQNGGNVNPQALAPMMISLEHSGQHLTFLQHDETKKAAFKALKSRFSHVQSVVRGMMVRAHAQQQQAQQGGPTGGPQQGAPQGGGQPMGQAPQGAPPQMPMAAGM